MMETHGDQDHLIRSNSRFRDTLKIMLKPEMGFVKIILINTIYMSILGLAIPFAIQSIINNIGVRHLVQPVVVLGFVIFVFLSFSGILQTFQTYIIETLRRKLFIRFGSVIVERLVRYEDEHYQKINTPALINRYFDTLIAQSSMVNFFVEGSAFIFQYIICIVLLFFYHPYFVIFGFFLSLLFIASWLIFGPAGVRAGSPEADGRYDVVSWIDELGRSRNIFMSRLSREYAMGRFIRKAEDWLVVRQNLFKEQFGQSISLQVINTLVNATLIVLGGILVSQGELSLGQLVAATLMVSMIFSNLPRLQSFYISIYEYSTALDKIAEFYDHPLEKQKYLIESPVNYDIRLEEMNYEPNFKFNFEVPQGQKLYIHIKSYSAKKIFLDVLQGLKTPKSGSILIGNTNIIDLNLENMRDNIQVIEEINFFSGTILDNITGFCNREVTRTEIDQVLKIIGLDENIAALPLGLETVIMPNGFPLTRSQILSLQFARAIVSKPMVLVVTNDFEKISAFKRRRILQHIVSPERTWTLLFFSQRIHPDVFPHYSLLGRNGLERFKDLGSLKKVVESYDKE